jgi:hypothetical protein
MRYWVRIERETKGPFTPEQLRRIPGLTEESFVCPEGAKEAEDWRRLKEFPDVLKAIQTPPERPSPPPKPPSPAAPPSVPEESGSGIRAAALKYAVVVGCTVVGTLAVEHGMPKQPRQEQARPVAAAPLPDKPPVVETAPKEPVAAAQAPAKEASCPDPERQRMEEALKAQNERASRAASKSLRLFTDLRNRTSPPGEPGSVRKTREHESREALRECEKEARSMRAMIQSYIKHCGLATWDAFRIESISETADCAGIKQE